MTSLWRTYFADQSVCSVFPGTANKPAVLTKRPKVTDNISVQVFAVASDYKSDACSSDKGPFVNTQYLVWQAFSDGADSGKAQQLNSANRPTFPRKTGRIMCW